MYSSRKPGGAARPSPVMWLPWVRAFHFRGQRSIPNRWHTCVSIRSIATLFVRVGIAQTRSSIYHIPWSYRCWDQGVGLTVAVCRRRLHHPDVMNINLIKMLVSSNSMIRPSYFHSTLIKPFRVSSLRPNWMFSLSV